MDLMEYQAKELFAKHGVTTTLGVVVETADAAKEAAEEMGDNFSKKPIGTGPFMFAEYQPQQFVKLVANKQYFRGAPVLEEITYRYVPAAPELAALRDAAIFPNINRATYAVTIYPPAAQMLFALVGQIGDSMLAMKLAFVALEGLTVAVLLDLLRRTGQPPARIVASHIHRAGECT